MEDKITEKKKIIEDEVMRTEEATGENAKEFSYGVILPTEDSAAQTDDETQKKFMWLPLFVTAGLLAIGIAYFFLFRAMPFSNIKSDINLPVTTGGLQPVISADVVMKISKMLNGTVMRIDGGVITLAIRFTVEGVAKEPSVVFTKDMRVLERVMKPSPEIDALMKLYSVELSKLKKGDRPSIAPKIHSSEREIARDALRVGDTVAIMFSGAKPDEWKKLEAETIIRLVPAPKK